MSGALLSLFLALQASATPSPAAQHLHAGVEAEKSGHLDAAAAEFQKATELDPKLAIAFVDLGDILHGEARLRRRHPAAEAGRRA